MSKRGSFIAGIGAFLSAGAVYYFLPADCAEPARRMAAIFVIAALFWALEIIPLFATSIGIVLLQIFLLAGDHGIPELGKYGYRVFFNPFASPIIMLFLGGFVLAQGFQRYNIDKNIAMRLLRLFGTRPYPFLLGLMIATAFLSMWISNTATAALMIMMIHPFLSDLKHEKKFTKAIVLAVAFAAGIGGIATPVSTPPNAIAIGMLEHQGIHINFFQWMKMAIPLEILLILFISVLLYVSFRPSQKNLALNLDLKHPLNHRAKWVLGIGVLTAGLWMTSAWHGIHESVVALVAVLLLTGSGLIGKAELKAVEWDILILMWGGLAMGEGMERSGLANWVIGLPLFSQQGFGLVIAFCIVSALLSTFISNTATVNLLIPIALSIPGENPVMLATAIALASSFDIALPMATPPMAIAYGTGAVSVRDMLKVGIIFSVVANIVLLAGFRYVIPRTIGLG